MNIPVEIDAEKVNQAVAEAVLKSTLGEAIKSSIEQNVKQLLGWSGPVQEVVKQVTKEYVKQLIDKEYIDQIRTEIRMFLTKDKIREIVNLWGERMMRNI
jgi:hypothetical protein